MSTILNFEEEIKKAKEETIQKNREAWINDYQHKHPSVQVAPEPPLEEITPKSWFIKTWDKGFIVADLEKLMELPKKTREKILALGGIT